MTIGTPAFPDAPHDTSAGVAVKTRDAGNTQQLLLAAARLRFARDGYAATRVRDIAADAGVNMALINRYFTSKEGLFEACLVRVVEDFDSDGDVFVTVERILHTMVRQVTDSPTSDYQLRLLLLLRTSGDERADAIRRSTLRSFSERIAAAGGWYPGRPDGEQLVLRAQLAMSAVLGAVLLRTTPGLEPLASATVDQITEPMRDLLTTLLSPHSTNPDPT